MLQMNKSELKTNETFITQITNALFYKVDINRLLLVTCLSVNMQELIHQQNINKAILKTFAKIIYLLHSLIKHKTKVTLIIVSKITCILLLCKRLKPAPFFSFSFFLFFFLVVCGKIL